MKKNVLNESQINYNIYNALNLYSEELGQQYLSTEFNPFPNSFELTENFVVERFVNSSKKREILEPEFVSQGEQTTQEAFEQSISNCQAMIAEIEAKLADENLPQSLKEELKKLKTYLLCRIELLNINLKNMPKNKNTLKMYEMVEGLDWKLADMMEESYKEMFNVQIAINAFLENAKENSAAYKKELENRRLIEKAKAIISSNQKQQEAQSMQQQQQEQTEQTQIIQTKQSESKPNKQIAQQQTKQSSFKEEDRYF